MNADLALLSVAIAFVGAGLGYLTVEIGKRIGRVLFAFWSALLNGAAAEIR